MKCDYCLIAVSLVIAGIVHSALLYQIYGAVYSIIGLINYITFAISFFVSAWLISHLVR